MERTPNNDLIGVLAFWARLASLAGSPYDAAKLTETRKGSVSSFARNPKNIFFISLSGNLFVFLKIKEVSLIT